MIVFHQRVRRAKFAISKCWQHNGIASERMCVCGSARTHQKDFNLLLFFHKRWTFKKICVAFSFVFKPLISFDLIECVSRLSYFSTFTFLSFSSRLHSSRSVGSTQQWIVVRRVCRSLRLRIAYCHWHWCWCCSHYIIWWSYFKPFHFVLRICARCSVLTVELLLLLFR